MIHFAATAPRRFPFTGTGGIALWLRSPDAACVPTSESSVASTDSANSVRSFAHRPYAAGVRVRRADLLLVNTGASHEAIARPDLRMSPDYHGGLALGVRLVDPPRGAPGPRFRRVPVRVKLAHLALPERERLWVG